MAGQNNNADSLHVKWMQRRAIAIFSSFFLLILGTAVISELAHPLYAVDDFFAIAVGVISLFMFLYIYKNRKSNKDIETSMNVFTVLVLLLILVKIAFILIEAGDADALGDDIPTVLVGIMIVISRFV